MKKKEISFILSSHERHKGDIYLGPCIFCEEKCYGTGKQFNGWEAKEYKPIGIKKIIAGECLRSMLDAFEETIDELHQNITN